MQARRAAARSAAGPADGGRTGIVPRRAPARRRRPQEPRRLHAHRRPRLVEEIRELAEPLKGRRVVHLSATAFGGGVVGDPLHARPADARRRARGRVAGHLRPRGVLQRDQADAQRAAGQPAGPHRGAVGDLAQLQRDERARARRAAGTSCIVHDPQPAALRSLVPEKARGWIWRCHIDLSTPNPATIERLLPYISDYPRRSSTSPHYVPGRAWTAASTSCRRRSTRWRRRTWRSRPRTRSFVCEQFGIDVDRPLMCQVSRFDPWKDPLGRDRRVPARQGGAARRAARARRLDGLRRPRGLGLLQRDARARRRRPGHPHPQQLQQRRRDRGQRVPVARRRA